MKVTKTNEKSILDFSEETTLEDWLLYWLDANDSQRVLETYLFEHFGHKEAGILLALYTGMRLGEICALRWKNYQESTGMLSVESTVRRISDIDSNPMASKTQLVFGSVKTTFSERELYMPDVVQQLLKLQRERFAKEFGREACDEDFIVFNRCGRVMDPDNLSHYFSRILRQLHLEHVKFHAMRHTFATRAIENGIDVATVSGLLGHADVTTTTHFYVHPRDEAMRAAMRGIVPVGTVKFGNGA